MLDHDQRAAILTLQARGLGIRAIAKAMGISRNSVRRVLAAGVAEVPKIERAEQLEAHAERVQQLYRDCRGNLVRVHEELTAEGIEVAYSTLTGFCRRRGIGVAPKQRVGQYPFEPGAEMQHDTSPHEVQIAGRKRKVHCASLVLCFSRMLYAQVYLRWTRFQARVFLTQAIQYMGGAAAQCMLDNSTVIMAKGQGKDAVPAESMQALAERFGFAFVAHEVGHADRSARVERPFHYIENNFYAGRRFESLRDLNTQLAAWCDQVNHRPKRHLKARPIELYATEQPALKRLPAYIPEVYELHPRRVDVEGYVRLHGNRYSVDADYIGQSVDVRETHDQLRIFWGPRLIQVHDKRETGAGERVRLPEHIGDGRHRRRLPPAPEDERLLRAQGPEIEPLIDALQRRYGGRARKAVRKLHRIWQEYPTEAVIAGVKRARHYGLIDLDRIERLVLKAIQADFFNLPTDPEDNGDG